MLVVVHCSVWRVRRTLVVDLDVSLALALLRNVSMMLKLLVSLMPKLQSEL
jgi:hypothetical protein